MKNDNQEIKMLTQGFFFWLISSLLVFVAWLICALLIYFGLQYFNDLSSSYSLLASTIIATVIVGLILYRHYKIG